MGVIRERCPAPVNWECPDMTVRAFFRRYGNNVPILYKPITCNQYETMRELWLAMTKASGTPPWSSDAWSDAWIVLTWMVRREKLVPVQVLQRFLLEELWRIELPEYVANELKLWVAGERGTQQVLRSLSRWQNGVELNVTPLTLAEQREISLAVDAGRCARWALDTTRPSAFREHAYNVMMYCDGIDACNCGAHSILQVQRIAAFFDGMFRRLP